MSENPNYQQNPGEFIPAPQQAPAYNMQGGYPGYQRLRARLWRLLR